MPRPLVVQKFGGSSVATVEKLHAVASLVAEQTRQGKSVVVVVSAMGDTTDGLLKRATEVNPSPPQRELDMMVTAGERISMALLSMAIHRLGVEAKSFTGSQSGIITEAKHQGARILEVRPHRIREAIEDGKVAIVAGFQGMSIEREITTLGRGGTDTTAVALAAALDAQCCEIYSDVDGVYSADPRVCPQAGLIETLDYETMQTIAQAGARVLNADAVDFARRAGITIAARKTGDESGRQTLIQANTPGNGAVAVVGDKNVSIFQGDRGFSQGAVIAAAKDVGGKLKFLQHYTNEWEVGFSRTDIPNQQTTPLDHIAASLGLKCQHRAQVTVVGHGLCQSDAVLQTLAASPWTCSLTDNAARVLCEPEECDDIVRDLHQALIESPQSVPESD